MESSQIGLDDKEFDRQNLDFYQKIEEINSKESTLKKTPKYSHNAIEGHLFAIDRQIRANEMHKASQIAQNLAEEQVTKNKLKTLLKQSVNLLELQESLKEN